MSREMRRVALDFNWPTGKVWKGYILPEHLRMSDCRACDGGWSPTASWLNDSFYSRDGRVGWHDKITQAEADLLVQEGRIKGPATAEEINARQRDGWILDRHDGVNKYILVKHRCELLGVSEVCDVCKGEGSTEAYPGQRQEAEDWEPEEPPAGEGWQLWETVSEGSPLSPVFATREEMVDWLVNVGAWNQTYSREAAERLCDVGFSLGSFVFTPETGLQNGVEALTLTKE